MVPLCCWRGQNCFGNVLHEAITARCRAVYSQKSWKLPTRALTLMTQGHVILSGKAEQRFLWFNSFRIIVQIKICNFGEFFSSWLFALLFQTNMYWLSSTGTHLIAAKCRNEITWDHLYVLSVLICHKSCYCPPLKHVSASLRCCTCLCVTMAYSTYHENRTDTVVPFKYSLNQFMCKLAEV
jgi:hypothetical protein